ncbi:2-amino-4-hydroxy-6-hydroxymethyldihydropteridine diphosphokinase [Alkalicoccus chagannorensis]|uniref:2-amino-4-hydroxy-6- hydroxymethyldihydropteridine diphosphokinase n=1 Tax=Alkalicoccus chagannorensis TaxID=427072 RepID=UPI00040DEF5C|nr:2-amino-4-hydroxy-6-hydroxymethyldihydropteridine diphosphokinase [Alkalicoccus chagannorensis]
MKTVYVSLGANMGDRIEQVKRAIQLLDGCGGVSVSTVSSLYETEPVGVTDQPEFVNAVVELHTDLSPLELLSCTQKIEADLGRVRRKKWGPRTIDLDILLYGNENIELESLIIPHPRMTERAFVLVPLAEIAPDLQLPDGTQVQKLASAQKGSAGIRPVSSRGKST